MAAVLWFALGLASSGPATQSSPPWDCDPARQAQAQADAALVKRFYATAPSGRPALLRDLEAALDRAPPGPLRKQTTCGDTIVIHSREPTADVLAAAMVAAAQPGSPHKLVQQPTPYEEVALLAGSLLDEAGRYDDAVSVLRRGDALEPGNAVIAPELAFALAQTHRNADAVAVIDAALGQQGEPPVAEARLHRTRGYALGELGRYDEAIADYRLSQKLDPTERVSANEITYLEGRKAGDGRSQVLVITSDHVADPLPNAKPSPRT